MRAWQRISTAGALLVLVGALAMVPQMNNTEDTFGTVLSLVAIVAIGVGGSVLASGLVTGLIARQVFGIDVAQAVEALRGSSALTRSKQSLEVTLTVSGDEIRASAEHRFDLREASWTPRRRVFQMYTDIARWGSSGGFASIVEPDGKVLRGNDLATCVTEYAGKARFERAYLFYPGQPLSFIAETFGLFRRSDRLIWTVEHISSDFRVRVNDCTGLGGTVEVKINHHREADIATNMTRRPYEQGVAIEFEFVGEILPYQGFELQWAFA